MKLKVFGLIFFLICSVFLILLLKKTDNSCIKYEVESLPPYSSNGIMENQGVTLTLKHSPIDEAAKIKFISICAELSEEVDLLMGDIENNRFYSFFRLYTGNNDHFNLEINWSDGQLVSLREIPVQHDLFIRHPDNNPAKNYNLEPYLSRALTYFQNIVHFEPGTLLMLDGLRRTFSLEGFDEIPLIYKGIVSKSKGKAKDILSVNWRMIDRSRTVSKGGFEQLSSIDLLTMPALHCDYLDLPSDIIDRWLAALEYGGYEATHVALGYMWALDNECFIHNLPDDFPSKLATTLVSLVDTSDGLNDLEVESMCFLLLLDREDLFIQDWLELLLKQQNPDGGWAATPGSSTSVQHTSTLATCVLLDLNYYNMSFTTLPSKISIID